MKAISHPAAIMVLAVIINVSSFVCHISAQGTAFTYQGRLSTGASPLSGYYDILFSLYDAETTGTRVAGPILISRAPVINGAFNATLDFGAAPFTGTDRWLLIEVRTNSSAFQFVPLTPRQPLKATPYAIRAGNFSGTISGNQITGTISSSNIAAGSIGREQLASNSVTAAAIANNAITAQKIALTTDSTMLTITGSSYGSTNEFFAANLAPFGSNSLLTITRTGFFIDAPDTSAAHLYSLDGSLISTFRNPSSGTNESFGSSLSAVGNDRVLIGASANDPGASNAGIAYLFSTNGSLLTTFTNPTPADSDLFGSSAIALGNDRVVIGAATDSTSAFNAGAVYVFNTNGKMLTTILNPVPHPGDVFGNALAPIGNDRFIAGASLDDTRGFNAGVAYLFTANGTLVTNFYGPSSFPGGRFGSSLAALGNDRILIGSPGEFVGTRPMGAAHLFNTNGTLLLTFTNPAPTSSGMGFGQAVASMGTDRLLIGGGVTPATVYLFRTNGTLLATFTNPAPIQASGFDRHFAGVGERVAFAAFSGNNNLAADRGAIYVFTIDTFTRDLIADGVRKGSITTASLADGSVTAAKIGGQLLTSQIPNLDATKIATGVISDARLSANVSLLGSSIESNEITDGTIVNADINPAAAIADTKLATIASPGKVADTALSPSVSLLGPTIESAEIADGTIIDADIDPAAGIRDTKLATISTPGKIVDSALSANIALRSGGNTFNDDQTITGNLNVGCDTNRMTDFTNVDSRAILTQVATLPVRKWRYTNELVNIRHIAANAQDFRAAFGLGSDDKTINTLDQSGVALSAIQGLSRKLDDELALLRAENSALRQRLDKAEELIKRILDENH